MFQNIFLELVKPSRKNTTLETSDTLVVWWTLNFVACCDTAQVVNWIGWVPLRLYDSSDVESLDSDERGEIEGEFLLEFRDPTNDDVVSPDSVSMEYKHLRYTV